MILGQIANNLLALLIIIAYFYFLFRQFKGDSIKEILGDIKDKFRRNEDDGRNFR